MSITEVFAKYIRPYYYYLITFVVFIIFWVAANYAYNKYFKTSVNKFKDVANANRTNKEATILFFNVDWCPHCKTALPEWNTFKSKNNETEINGYLIKCVDMNCTDETSDVTRAINEYKIESYPTVKMLRDGQIIEFDSKISNSALESFVTTMLND
jgi:thiol-disulfide isomerase/thioredoxin